MAPREEAGWLESSPCSEGHLLGGFLLPGTPEASNGIREERFTYNQSWGSKTEPPSSCSPPLPPVTPGMVPQQKQRRHEGMARGAGKSWELLNLPVITKRWAP